MTAARTGNPAKDTKDKRKIDAVPYKHYPQINYTWKCKYNTDSKCLIALQWELASSATFVLVATTAVGVSWSRRSFVVRILTAWVWTSRLFAWIKDPVTDIGSCNAINQNHHAYNKNKAQELWLHIEPSDGQSFILNLLINGLCAHAVCHVNIFC